LRRAGSLDVWGHLGEEGHVRMEAKRRALEEIAARQCAADEKRGAEVERKLAAAAA
jgi:hypothetical protein